MGKSSQLGFIQLGAANLGSVDTGGTAVSSVTAAATVLSLAYTAPTPTVAFGITAAATTAGLTYFLVPPVVNIFNPLPPSTVDTVTILRRGVDKGPFHLIPLTPHAVEIRRAVSGDPAASSAGASSASRAAALKTQQQWRPVAEAFEVQQRNNDRLRDELVAVASRPPATPVTLGGPSLFTFNVPGELAVASGLTPEDGIYYVMVSVPTGYRASLYEAWALVSNPPSTTDIECSLYHSIDAGDTWSSSILTAPLTIPAHARTSGASTDFSPVPYLMDREDRLRLSIDQVGSVDPGDNLVVIVRYNIIRTP